MAGESRSPHALFLPSWEGGRHALCAGSDHPKAGKQAAHPRIWHSPVYFFKFSSGKIDITKFPIVTFLKCTVSLC